MHITPKVAFVNVVVFVVVSLFYFIGHVQISKAQAGATKAVNLKLKIPSYRLLDFFRAGKRNTNKLVDRELLWETLLNKTASKPRRKRYPDAILVGAESCGTDALTRLLSLHPAIKTPQNAEASFFSKKYDQGAPYYKEIMPWATEDHIVLESSPNYFTWPPFGMPKRIKNLLPNVKILLLLCDPVNRTFVDFNEEKNNQRIGKTMSYEIFLGTYIQKLRPEKWREPNQWEVKSQKFLMDTFLQDYPSHIISSGIYYYHVQRWKSEFTSENLAIISREDMLKQPGLVAEKLQSFLGLPKVLLKEDFIFNNQSSSYCFQPIWSTKNSTAPEIKCPLRYEAKKQAMQSAACAQSLRIFFNSFNKKLYNYLERDFHW